MVYGGTYPGGRLFSFDPSSGNVVDLGQPNAGETYVRSIAATEKYVFVGSQPNARLARLDRSTGEVTPVQLPFEEASETYDLTVAGGLLFARIQPSGTMLVFDVESLELKNSVDKISGRVISGLDPTGKFVLFRLNNKVDPVGIYRYYIDDHRIEATGWNPKIFPGSFRWHRFADQEKYPGESVVVTYYRGRTYSWNPTSRKGIYIGEKIMEPTPNPIQRLGADPDGKIYAPGFLSPPSMAQFDPETDEFAQLPGAGQVEGLGSFDELLVMGRYPGGQLTAWDRTRPWKSGTNPPDPISIGYDQDRPQSLIQVGDEVAISSVPKSGRLGGAISMWNPRTNEIRSYLDLVPNQAPVSLALHKGVLWAGSTINGGYGIEPVAKEAVLFAIDPVTGEKVFETVPWPGASNITALTLDGDGMLWAIADGALIKFDPETRKVIRAEQVFPAAKSMYGTQNELLFRDDGYLYAVSAGSLWRVDPTSFERIRLAGHGVHYMAQDAEGQLYFSRVATLYRWNFNLESPIDATAPVTTANVTGDGGEPGEVEVTLTSADEGGSGLDYIEYRVGDLPWRRYETAIGFDEPGRYQIYYRAVDKHGNVEGAKSVTVEVKPHSDDSQPSRDEDSAEEPQKPSPPEISTAPEEQRPPADSSSGDNPKLPKPGLPASGL